MGLQAKKYLKENLVDSFKLVDRKLIKRRINGLLLGQLISLMIAGTGIFSQLLVTKYGVNMPTAQSLLNYILLMGYCGVLIYRGTLWETFKTKWKIMIPLALVDVEANYVVVKAYQYGSITSIMLLDCWTIPVVVVLSRVFLKTRYTLVHIGAVVISIAGMVILFINDIIHGGDAGGGSNPLLGDFLCLISSTLYAISNVGQEYTVKRYDRITYLAMIGVFGSIISSVQLAILERNELQTMQWNSGATGYIIGFALCLFIMYSITPKMMQIAGSTLMNLSLLTSDIFGLLAAIFLFDSKLSWMYFLAFVVICSGLIIYNLTQPHVKSEEAKTLMNPTTSSDNLDGLNNNSNEIGKEEIEIDIDTNDNNNQQQQDTYQSNDYNINNSQIDINNTIVTNGSSTSDEESSSSHVDSMPFQS